MHHRAHTLYLKVKGRWEESLPDVSTKTLCAAASGTSALLVSSQFFQQRRPGLLLGLNELGGVLRRQRGRVAAKSGELAPPLGVLENGAQIVVHLPYDRLGRAQRRNH